MGRRMGLLKSFRIGMQSAWLEILSNRFRSILTLAGIALSTGALAAILSIQAGARSSTERNIADMGGLGRVGIRTQPPRNLAEEIRFSRSRGLRLSDADSLNFSHKGLIQAFKANEEASQIRYQGMPLDVKIRGVNQEALESGERIIVDTGRHFHATEYALGSRVAIIGWMVAERLHSVREKRRMEDRSSLGEFLDVAGQRYKVVGRFVKFSSEWDDPGFTVYVPIQAMLRDLSGNNPRVEWMNIQVGNPAALESQTKDLAAYLRVLHRGVPDVTFRFFEWIEDYRRTMRTLNLIFIAVAAIALLVGAVNILNVMLSTIAERVREIGVRKALGASSFEIFLQFLVESLTLSLLGGMLGCLLGLLPLAFAGAIASAADWARPEWQGGSVLWVLGLSVLMGVVAGVTPAMKAARMDPMEALRYE